VRWLDTALVLSFFAARAQKEKKERKEKKESGVKPPHSKEGNIPCTNEFFCLHWRPFSV
jgi:hypothetical protein